MAYWVQRRNSGHDVQVLTIFSGTHTCGTMEKFCRMKNRGSCVKAVSVS